MNKQMKSFLHDALRLLRNSVIALGIAVLFILQASAGEPFEIRLHDTEVRGTRDLEVGDYRQGIEKLERMLGHQSMAQSRRVAVLSNLCVAYTMLGDFEDKEETEKAE